MLKVKLPDGSVREYSGSVRPIDVAAEIGPGLAKATLAAEVDGKVVGRHAPLPTDGEVSLRLLTKKDPEALAVMRHSAAHVMARAVMRLFDGVQLAFGPTIDNGFYYDFELAAAAHRGRLSGDRSRDGQDHQADEPFERLEEPRDKAVAICRDLGQTFKVEHIEHRPGRPRDAVVLSPGRVHRSLPRPAHAQRRRDRRVQAAVGRRRLLEGRRHRASSCSGCTPPPGSSQARAGRASRRWSKRPSAATTACSASNWSCSPPARLVGSGLILWLPKGAIIRGLLEAFIRDELTKRGYQPVYTPNIGRVELYQISGHFPVLRRQPVQADRDVGRRAVPAQADELPAPHHDLQVEAAQLSRPAGAAGGVRHGLSLRAIGRARRHDPRPRLHPGRRPPVLHRGAGRPTSSAAASR